MSTQRDWGSSGFGDGDLYDAVRPDYPEAAITYFVRTFDLNAHSAVVDLGAGSGIFTRQIRPWVGGVTAVEPSASMRRTLSATTPDVTVMEGSDVAIPLPDGLVDVVFAAQAFHWFDAPRALAEIHRVLRSGGGLGLIWNERDERVAWVRDLGEAMQWPHYQPYAFGRDFSPEVLAGPFARLERTHFTHAQPQTRDQLRRRVLSTSYVSLMSERDRAQVMSDVEQVIGGLDEPIVMPYVTDVYRASAA